MHMSEASIGGELGWRFDSLDDSSLFSAHQNGELIDAVQVRQSVAEASCHVSVPIPVELLNATSRKHFHIATDGLLLIHKYL